MAWAPTRLIDAHTANVHTYRGQSEFTLVLLDLKTLLQLWFEIDTLVVNINIKLFQYTLTLVQYHSGTTEKRCPHSALMSRLAKYSET